MIYGCIWLNYIHLCLHIVNILSVDQADRIQSSGRAGALQVSEGLRRYSRANDESREEA